MDEVFHSTSHFLRQSTHKVMLITGNNTNTLDVQLLFNHIIENETQFPLIIDVSQSSSIDNVLLDVPFDQLVVFIFIGMSIENLFVKHSLDRWQQAKAIFIRDSSLLHPTLDPSIYFAPVKRNKIQRQLLTKVIIQGLMPAANLTVSATQTTPTDVAVHNETIKSNSLHNHYLNQKLMANDAVAMQMLADRVMISESFKAFLFKLVYSSRENQEMQIAAANAITILKCAKISFSRMDFSKIRIPSANLEGAIFYASNLSNADLTGVNIKQAVIEEAVFDRATLKDIDFGEEPYFEGDNGDQILDLSFDFKGERLAASTSKGVIHIWDASSRDKLITINVFDKKRMFLDYPVKSICFSPNKSFLASSSHNAVKIWDIVTGELQNTFEGHTEIVNCVCISPDGCLLVSGSADKTICVVNMTDNTTVGILRGHTASINHLCFSSKGHYLLSGDSSGSVHVWSMLHQKSIYVFNENTGGKITSVAINRDDSLVAATCKNSIYIWNFNTQQLLFVFNDATIKETDVFSSVQFSPGQRSLFTTTEDGRIHVWNIDDNRLSYKLAAGFSGCSRICLNPNINYGDVNLIYIGLSIGVVKCLKINDELSAERLRYIEGHTNQIETLSCHSERKLLATGAADEVILWNMNNCSIIKRYKNGNLGSVSRVSISPKGKLLAIAYHCKSAKALCISVWDLENNNVLYHLLECKQDSSTYISQLLFTQDGRFLISSSLDGTIQFWDIANGSLVHTIKQSGVDDCKCICISTKGDRLAFGIGNNIYVWDISNISKSQQLFVLQAHTQQVESISFNPDDSILASAGCDKIVIIWSVLNGKQLYKINTHKGCVDSICFSPEGNWLLSSSYREIHIWNMKTQKSEGHFIGHHGKITGGIKFISDKQFITGCSDNVLRLWELSRLGDRVGVLLNWASHSTSLMTGHHYARDSSRLTLPQNVSEFPPGFIDISHALHLSRKNRKLLDQYGAIDGDLNLMKNMQELTFLKNQSNSPTTLINSKEASEFEKRTITSLPAFSIELDSPLVINCLAFSRDGKWLAVGTGSYMTNDDIPGSIFLYELPARSLVYVFTAAHKSGVCGLNFSPDANLLASGGGDGCVCLWDIKQKALRHKIIARSKVGSENSVFDIIENVVFNQSGEQLVSVCWDGTLRVWSIKSDAPVVIYQENFKSLRHTIIDPNGSWIIASITNRVLVYDTKSFKRRHDLKDPLGDQITSLAFHPNGKWFASGPGNINKNEKSIQLWDVESGKPIRRFKGPTRVVKSIAFHPNGKWFAAASMDKVIYLWHMEEEVAKHIFHLHDAFDPGNSVAGNVVVMFHPTEAYLVVAEKDNVIRQWSINYDQLLTKKNSQSQPEAVFSNKGITSTLFNKKNTSNNPLKKERKASDPFIAELNKMAKPISEQANDYKEQARGNKEMLKLAIMGHKKVLEILMVEGCSRNPNIGLSLSNLGFAYSDLGGEDNIALAIECHQNAIDSLAALLDDDELDHNFVLKILGSTLNNLGYAYWKKGGKENNLEALKYYEQSYEILKETSDKNPGAMVMALSNLAVILTDMNDEKTLYKAIEYHKSAREILVRLVGDTHERVAVFLHNLACAYLKLLHTTQDSMQWFAYEAIRCYETALAISLHNNHFNMVSQFCSRLAHLYVIKNNLDAAETYFQQALEMQESALNYCEFGLFLIYLSYSSKISHLSKAIPYLRQTIDLGDDKSILEYRMFQKNILDKYLKQEVVGEQTLRIEPVLLARYLLIQCYKKLNDAKSAETCLQELSLLVAKNPSPLHYRLLSYIHQFLGNMEMVEKYKALSLSAKPTEHDIIQKKETIPALQAEHVKASQPSLNSGCLIC